MACFKYHLVCLSSKPLLRELVLTTQSEVDPQHFLTILFYCHPGTYYYIMYPFMLLVFLLIVWITPHTM